MSLDILRLIAVNLLTPALILLCFAIKSYHGQLEWEIWLASAAAYTTYVYLRGATMAVAALLLILLVGDVLLPPALAPMPAPQLQVGRVSLQEAEAPVAKALPAEERLDVAVEKVVAQREPLAEVAVEKEGDGLPTPMGTPLPPDKVLEIARPDSTASGGRS